MPLESHVKSRITTTVIRHGGVQVANIQQKHCLCNMQHFKLIHRLTLKLEEEKNLILKDFNFKQSSKARNYYFLKLLFININI